MKNNKFVGAHVSTSGGVENAPLNAARIGAKAFAMFTKNQRRWDAKPLTDENIRKFKENMELNNYKPENVLPHDGYLINLGHPDPEKREKSLRSFIDEVNRTNQLGLLYLNFHPGSHLREITEEEALQNVSDSMNTALKETNNVSLIIEATAGQGSNLGYKFEHLAFLIENSIDKDRVGVCIDTCHIYAAGYDIGTSKETFENVMSEFDRIIGIKYLKGMHLNDSKSTLGNKKDRHHSIGLGELGEDTFKWIMQDDRFNNIPMVLETIDDSIWDKEIELLYSFEK